jgi:hypothetical protein
MISRTRFALLIVFASALVAAGWFARRGKKEEPPDLVNGDPRATYDTPFRNVRPEVNYVGSKTCAACHIEHVESYAKHPMGRSFAPLVQNADDDRYDGEAHNPFEKFGNIFRIEHQGPHVVHKVRRAGVGAETLFELANDVEFVMGSGSHGRAYVINRDGYLYQSPISWYTQKSAWDLSPGYAPETLFDRPIHVQCLYCHSNDARHVADSINRYHQPLAREYAIGCERCHGPAELHVQERGRQLAPDGKTDYSIVNPRKLDPPLRDAVCEQCHLQGEARIVRRGRDMFDYRPGLPLHLFWSVFMRLPELRDDKAVTQVEQMRLSRCYLASKGQLGCISCHDPHVLPRPSEKSAYYRGRCQECHGQTGQTACGAPLAERRKNDNACHVCHMPPLNSTDIAHTAMSDHRVLRVVSTQEAARKKRTLLPGEVPLVHFHRQLVEKDDDEVQRDLGLALTELAQRNQRSAEPLLLAALPMLDKAIRDTPRDVPTREARGYALWLEHREKKALEDIETVLAVAPERERSLAAAAYITMALDKLEVSADYWERLIAVNPWSVHYRADQARLFLRRREWSSAIGASRAALGINPANVNARQILVEALLRDGDRDRARSEFDVLLAVAPPENEEALRRWYSERNR